MSSYWSTLTPQTFSAALTAELEAASPSSCVIGGDSAADCRRERRFSEHGDSFGSVEKSKAVLNRENKTPLDEMLADSVSPKQRTSTEVVESGIKLKNTIYI